MFYSKKQELIILGLIGATVISSGCASSITGPNVKEVPEDFVLHYSYGPCAVMHGRWTDITVYANGSAKVEVGPNKPVFSKQKSFQLNEEEVLSIYRTTRKVNFFNLKEEYRDPNAVDGSCSQMKIEAEGESHKVEIANRNPQAVEKIGSKLQEILSKKDEKWNEINIRKICNRLSKKCANNTASNRTCRIIENRCIR